MALNSGFSITGLTLLAGGSGFANSTTYNLIANDPGQGSGLTGTCATNGSGVVTSTSITANGSNYSSGSWSHQPQGSAITTLYSTTYPQAVNYGATTVYTNASVTTTNNIKLSLRETSTHKVDFTVGDTGQLTIHPSGNSIMLHNDSNMGSASFVSGFAGSGWQLSKDSANEYTAEFDNLTVRGTMSVYELLIQQIRASNGSVIIGSADKVVAVEQISGSSYKFTVESDEADGGSIGNDFIHFKEDDLIIAQKWSGTSGDPPYTPVKRVRASVTATSNSGGSS